MIWRWYVDRVVMLTGSVNLLVREGCAVEPVSIIVAVLPVREERDESVRGLVAGRWPLVEGGNSVEGAAFEFQVGVEVDLRGLDGRVSEPKSAMLAVSIPACRSVIAQVCRRVCGVMFFPVRLGQCWAAVAV